jgi:hypothetical protein
MVYHNVEKHFETFFLMLMWFKLQNPRLGKQYNVITKKGCHFFNLRKISKGRK